MGFCSWDSPGKNTGVGFRVLLQKIFPTMVGHLVIKRNEVLTPAMTRMNLEDIMLNEEQSDTEGYTV